MGKIKSSKVCKICGNKLHPVYGLRDRYRCLGCDIIYTPEQTGKEFDGEVDAEDFLQLFTSFVKVYLDQDREVEFERIDRLFKKYNLAVENGEVVVRD